MKEFLIGFFDDGRDLVLPKLFDFHGKGRPRAQALGNEGQS